MKSLLPLLILLTAVEWSDLGLAILGVLAFAAVAVFLLAKAADTILGGGKSMALLISVIFLTTTVSAQERFTSYTVSESSAWAAWESKDFTQLKEKDATNGPWVKLVLPTETVESLRQGRLGDIEAIQASLVSALGIVLPPPVCKPEEPDKDDLRRFLRVPSEQMCRKI